MNTPRTDADAFRRMTRRQLLALAPLAVIGGIAVPSWRERLLGGGLAFSDFASSVLARPALLAPTYPDAALTPLDRFPYNSFDAVEPELDLDAWRLHVEGAVARPGAYPLDAIKALPRHAQNVRHVCIEGWSVIGSFAGARLADFLALVGVDPAARFVEVTCYDDYYTSCDLANCLHPQTLLCYEMYGRPLDRGHGAPLRIHLPTKLGYKSAKYLFSLRVSAALGPRRGFWEDQGYSWHGGI
jgi:DMSO/TMAO reductase YedYZ molybdopterin-dependent catalytic subunit